MTRPLHITAVGLVTALGLDADTTLGSLRAGLDAFRRVPFAGATGKDLQAAPIVGFAEAVHGVDRYEALAFRAISECLAGLDAKVRAGMAIFLGLPRAGRPGVPPDLARDLTGRLARRLGLAPERVVPLELGRAAVFAGLLRARALIDEGGATGCVVGGVDVLCNGDSLRGLSEAGQLKEDWDGFIAGEAAAFVQVVGSPAPGPWGPNSAAVTGIGAAREDARGDASDPIVGIGTCAAMRLACDEARSQDHDLFLYINDVNGARADFEDNAMGRTRFCRSPHHAYEVWHVASWLGETGAACGALQLAWAAAALDIGFAPGPGIMVSGSEGQTRAAAVVQRQSQGGPSRLRRSHGRAALQAAWRDKPDGGVIDGGLQPVAAAAGRRIGLQLPGDDLHAELTWRHLQELAWLWRMREHHLHMVEAPWLEIAGYEGRLWGHLDALAWMPFDRRHAVAGLRSEDPDEIAASFLLFLCFPMDAGFVASIVELASRSSLQLEILARAMPHLALGIAHPLMERLMAREEVACRQAALRAMTVMLRADPAWVRAGVQSADGPTAALAIQAAGALGMVEAVEWISARIDKDDDALQGAATRVALLSLGLAPDARGRGGLNRLAQEAPVAAALHASQGGVPFAELLTRTQPTRATVDACGWSGEVATVAHLLKWLDGEDDDWKVAADKSLSRIYGITAGPPGGDAPPDAAAWTAALRQAGLPTAGPDRLRHGVPWSPATPSAHLMRADCGYRERLVAAWEHAVVHRRGIPLHPAQFVELQRSALQRAQP